MRIVKDIQYGECKENQLDIYLPETDGYDAIVYFHGGGIVSGDKADESYTGIAQSFVKNGYAFISVNYRMYPTAKYPDYLEDCAKAVAWAKAHIKKYGGGGSIYISGQSAGAWISAMLCLNEKFLKAVDISPMEIKGWIIDSAQMTSHFNILKYERNCNPSLQRIDEYAPLYYVDENTCFTKMLVLFYEDDMPCRPEQNMLFIKALQHFNKNVDLQYRQLKGGHCHGSCHRDEDGEYAYAKESMKWLKNA